LRRITVQSLVVDRPLERPIYHASGVLLGEAGEYVRKPNVRIMLESGIEEVIELEPGDSREKLVFDCQTTLINVEDLAEGSRLSRAIYDSKDTLLLDGNQLVTRSIKEKLIERGIFEVFVKKSPEERGLRQVEKFHELLRIVGTIEKQLVEDTMQKLRSRFIKEADRELTVDGIEAGLRVDLESAMPSGPPLSKRMKSVHMKRNHRDMAHKKRFLDLHSDAVVLAKMVFDHARNDRNFDGDWIGQLCQKVVHSLIDDKELLLNLTHIKTPDDYLVAHSVNVTLLAINIAVALGYSESQVLEIAYGAFLHDIGMVKISAEVLTKASPLTAAERMEIQKHPIYGVNLLQKIRNIPRSVALVTYQSHERMDSTGYVKQRSPKMIHEFAKIVAVADVYEALTSERPYRKAMSPYRAMEDIIRMGNKKKLDAAVIRAFLKHMSLFPIGSWVELTDGRVGKVLAATDKNFDRPVVHVVFDTQRKPLLPPEIVDLGERADLKVVRALDGQEIQATLMEGF
jgi:HD-GYP domain-containing protein (c-di-GMP phosphodiesterase class II)